MELEYSAMTSAIYKSPSILFYPLILLWSLVYGSIAGALFKLFAVYENWLAINRLQITLWKKYPLRSYRKYISSMWEHQVRGKPLELAEYTRIELEKKYPEEPFPVMRILTNTVFMVFIAPFMALYGLVHGPAYVFRHSMERRRILNGKGLEAGIKH